MHEKTVTVADSIWAVSSLPISILAVPSIGVCHDFNNSRFRTARVGDTTSTTRVIKLLVRPMVGVSPKAILKIDVERSIRRIMKASNKYSLWVIFRDTPASSLSGCQPG